MESRTHINSLKLTVAHHAIQSFLPSDTSQPVQVTTDNIVTVLYINGQGGMGPQRLCCLALLLGTGASPTASPSMQSVSLEQRTWLQTTSAEQQLTN